MKTILLMTLATMMASAAWAGNQSVVEDLKPMIFGENAEAGATLIQKGKTSTGEDCVLTMHNSKSGIAISLTSRKSVGFWAAVSPKNSQYEITDGEEGWIEMTAKLRASSNGKFAEEQGLRLVTLERAGEAGINNVAEASISNKSLGSRATKVTCKFQSK